MADRGIVSQVRAWAKDQTLRIHQVKTRQVEGPHHLAGCGQLLDRAFIGTEEIELAIAAIGGEAARANQAGPCQVHPGDPARVESRRAVKTTLGVRRDANDLQRSAIQDEQIPVHRIHGHAARVLQAERPHAIPGDGGRRRIKVAVGIGLDRDQFVGAGIQEQEALGLVIEGQVHRVDLGHRHIESPDEVIEGGHRDDVRPSR